MPVKGSNKRVKSAFRFFGNFTRMEAFGGALLLLASLFALIWANSPWSDSYALIWRQTPLSVNLGPLSVSKPLIRWINDGLMSIFFFLIGLEMKREILMGQLSTWRKALLPIAAGIGGIVVPAAIYLAFPLDGPQAAAWGIPMTTDLAFALGVLSLLSNRVPASLKVFITTVAIIDDRGAILIYNLFHFPHISLYSLLIGLAILGIMWLGNLAKIRNTFFYAFVGIGGLWITFALTGMHATIASVLAAFAIPANSTIGRQSISRPLQSLVSRFRDQKNNSKRLSKGQLQTMEAMRKRIKEVQPPLQRMEKHLHPWVIYLILPIFALSNAGIPITGEAVHLFSHPLSVAIITGLLIGKSGGIFLFSWLAQKLNIADLPKQTNWWKILSASFLLAIGFTMSIYISDLAFTTESLLNLSKMAILVSSLLSGLLGVGLLFFKQKEPTLFR